MGSENPQDVVVGNSKIELTIGDCVILENRMGGSGYTGKSFNYYNILDGHYRKKES